MTCLEQTRTLQDANDEKERRLRQEAHLLARDLVTYRIGKASSPVTGTASTMRRISDELEEKHTTLLNNMCNQLNSQHGSTHTKFVQVADEVFHDGVNWGRIVAVFTFGAKLAEHYERIGAQENVEEVIEWIGSYISSLSDWIHNHGGWVGTMSCAVSPRQKLAI